MDIREEYIQGNILKIGQILEGNLEIIDRRSNYIVVADKNGKDYKMFLEEAFERIVENSATVQEQKTSNKKKTLRQILEGQDSEIDYKGYKTRNLKFFDELRGSLKEELSEQTEDPYANLRYLKAVDEMVAFYKKETEEGLTEEEINHLSRIIDRAKQYGHSKQSYKNTPYHDRDIRTTNAKDVEDEHPSHERDGIRLKKFVKQETTFSENSKINVRDFLAESVDFKKADQELDSLEKDKTASEKLLSKVDDFEDIAHLYDHDDIHIFEELTEALSREERIRRKIAFSKSKSKRERAKEIALKRLSSKPKLIKKSRKAAIELIKEHIARKPLNKLTVSEKERLENMISKRKELIDRLARKLAPKISQIERNRVYGQHVKEAKEQEEIVANLVDDDFVDVADSDEEEGNDVDKEQKDKAHDHHMRKKFVVEEECCEDMHESLREELIIEETEYQGRKVKLHKPFRTPGGPKKFAVYARNDKNNVVKVTFGDPNMSIKRDNPENRKAYRARHNCADPGPKWKANYWSCRMWSSKSVSDILAESLDDFPDEKTEGTFYHGGANVPTKKLHNISFFAPKREHAESYARVSDQKDAKIHEVQLKNLHKPARDQDVIQGAKELGHYEDEFTPANHYLTHSVVPQDNVYDLIYHLKSKGFDHARLHDNDYDGNEFTSVMPFSPIEQIVHKD